MDVAGRYKENVTPDVLVILKVVLIQLLSIFEVLLSNQMFKSAESY